MPNNNPIQQINSQIANQNMQMNNNKRLGREKILK